MEGTSPSHPFGHLVRQHLSRKHGLSQGKLAEGALLDPSIISDMCHGKRLSGWQLRERTIAIIRWLHEQGVLTSRAEANALLQAVGLGQLIADPEANDEADLFEQLVDAPDTDAEPGAGSVSIHNHAPNHGAQGIFNAPIYFGQPGPQDKL